MRIRPVCRNASFCVALWCPLLALGEAESPEVKARQLEYDPASGQWVESPPPVPGTALGDLQLARQAYAEEEYRRAHRLIERWLKTYSPDEPYRTDALLLRAEIEIARRDYYKAHRHLQELLDEFTGTGAAERAMEHEFVIAEVFLSGVKRKWLGMRILSAEDTALEILDEISATYPDSQLAVTAVRTKARHFYDRGEFALAEMEYSRLVQEFPRSRYARQAMRRSADAALASFAGIDFDDAPLIEAEERYLDYLASYPGAAEQEGIGQTLQTIHDRRAAKEYSVGWYYERTGHPASAALYYESTCRNWPETIAASQARERLQGLEALEPPPPGEAEADLATESAS